MLKKRGMWSSIGGGILGIAVLVLTLSMFVPQIQNQSDAADSMREKAENVTHSFSPYNQSLSYQNQLVLDSMNALVMGINGLVAERKIYWTDGVVDATALPFDRFERYVGGDIEPEEGYVNDQRKRVVKRDLDLTR